MYQRDRGADFFSIQKAFLLFSLKPLSDTLLNVNYLLAGVIITPDSLNPLNMLPEYGNKSQDLGGVRGFLLTLDTSQNVLLWMKRARALRRYPA